MDLRPTPPTADRDYVRSCTGLNVLLILADAHPRDALGCFGNPVIQTPSLDALARRGVRYSAAYCQNPICIPSRSSILTGRIPSTIGMYENGCILAREHTLLSDVFSRAGYVTAWFGKLHCGYGGARFQLFDRLRRGQKVLSEAEYAYKRLPHNASISQSLYERDKVVIETCQNFLRSNIDRPFFLAASLNGTHFPYEITGDYFDRYDGIVEPPSIPDMILDELPKVLKAERERWQLDKLTPEQAARARAVYYGMVTRLDDRVGAILCTLRELGLAENTIIVYTADHGEMAGDHGLWYKNSFYESAAAVPMIWSVPGETHEGWVDQRPAMNVDILPTLCELCGLPKPQAHDGMVLDSLTLSHHHPDDTERFAFIESFRGNKGSRALRYRHWKYCLYEDCDQLFDLARDPMEMANLVARPNLQDLKLQLRQKLLDGWSDTRRDVKRLK